MYTLMEDPVILPGSRVSIDRSTIRSHLLSDPHDPFNRAPLKMEDVTPGTYSMRSLLQLHDTNSSDADTELKGKIEAFKAERMAARRNPATQSAPETMDTSAD